jgi:Alpha-glucosidases, family 31 of glycosyl hydrolases
MIAVESIAEGFALIVDGRKVLIHSRRSPCLEIGRAENLAKQGRDSCKLRSRRVAKTVLRGFKLVESSAEQAVFDFEGALLLTARQEGSILRLGFSRFDESINFFKLKLQACPDERIFGCGASSDRLDRKGDRVSLWAQDRGIVKGLDPLRFLSSLASDFSSDRGATAFPSPAFISTKGYWYAVKGSAYATLDFRRNLTILKAWAPPKEIISGSGAEAPKLAAEMSAHLGRSPALPEWCFDGAWLEGRGGEAELERRLDAALAAGVKVAALWSRDSGGALPSGPGARPLRSLSGDAELYPDLAGTIAALRGRGIRFLGCASPLFDLEGPLYAEASSRGYCVKDSSGGDYPLALRSGSAAMLDLSSADATTWFKDLIASELLGIGMAGFLAYGGEKLPADAMLASGESAAGVHNRWPLLLARTCREAIDEASRACAGRDSAEKAAETVLLSGSGALGSGRYVNSFWLGESLATFDREEGLGGIALAAISLGLSGALCSHSAAGGSLSFAWARRSPECLCRWLELSAFSPLLRLEDGFRPESNAQFWSDPGCLANLARMSEVYAALKPYHLAVAAEASGAGLPAMRHPWLHYASDPRAERLSRQYLYGRDLMVAPAASPRDQATRLYLPADQWIHLWTSRAFRGGEVAVESPIGCPAVFYRASSAFAPLFDALRRAAGRSRLG